MSLSICMFVSSYSKHKTHRHMKTQKLTPAQIEANNKANALYMLNNLRLIISQSK